MTCTYVCMYMHTRKKLMNLPSSNFDVLYIHTYIIKYVHYSEYMLTINVRVYW